MKKITKSNIIVASYLLANSLLMLPVEAKEVVDGGTDSNYQGLPDKGSSAGATAETTTGDGLNKYVFGPFKNFSADGDYNTQFRLLMQIAWGLYFGLAILTFGYKFAIAIKDYFDAPDGGIHYNTKRELRNEVVEPLKGLILFMIIGVIVDMILGLLHSSINGFPDLTMGVLG